VEEGGEDRPTGRRDSYGGEIFSFKRSRQSWREANWVRLSATSDPSTTPSIYDDG